MKIGIGSDHAGFELKGKLKEHLEAKGYEVVDYGTHSLDSVDYPDYGKAVANAILAEEVEKGVLICGTGVGISISANKVKGIRACVCSEPYSAKMSVRHNNAQIIAVGARVVGEDLAKLIVDEFLAEEFEGGRHQRRIDKMLEIEK
ncbi:ribose 5-phosphate isomerase B [Peptoniphilus indolicus]|uniref:Ribose 5-phosphate isomerase B n=2 Tax=Peptoniphilus indolicus TaxID=33030 RepID=G4D3S4_9FIRM|nr:ribose 5-phosphate isomerase B [Peptoniphilus indolicus]EGY79821.1 ribose 5-phosphate isomerase B [Peptoniphilus indolicus ATCC 29427]SUB75748.1 Ribose-5-phosphate isomerase B [Peptoniphilus indolicus]